MASRENVHHGVLGPVADGGSPTSPLDTGKEVDPLEYQRQLRDLASEVSLVEERERRHIATELHDRVTQSLAISRIKLGEALKQLPDGPERADIESGAQHLDSAIEEIRDIMTDLSPPLLFEVGLLASVTALSDRIMEKHGFPCIVTCESGEDRMSPEQRILLFQSTRELMHNAAKHAEPQHLSVSLGCQNDSVRIEVCDDGCGFDPDRVPPPSCQHGRFGLFNIRERFAAVGGRVDVISKRGCGTRVVLVLPCEAPV